MGNWTGSCQWVVVRLLGNRLTGQQRAKTDLQRHLEGRLSAQRRSPDQVGRGFTNVPVEVGDVPWKREDLALETSTIGGFIQSTIQQDRLEL